MKSYTYIRIDFRLKVYCKELKKQTQNFLVSSEWSPENCNFFLNRNNQHPLSKGRTFSMGWLAAAGRRRQTRETQSHRLTPRNREGSIFVEFGWNMPKISLMMINDRRGAVCSLICIYTTPNANLFALFYPSGKRSKRNGPTYVENHSECSTSFVETRTTYIIYLLTYYLHS